MRVLRLDLAGASVELHPFVTIVRGLTAEQRGAVLDALAALPSGRAPLGGVLEAHGVLLPLTGETLELLDLTAGHDVVVRAIDLPGTASSPVADARRAVADAKAAVEAAEQVAAQADWARQAAVEALEAARAGDDSDPLAAQRAEHERLAAAVEEAAQHHTDAVAAEHRAALAVLEAEAAVEAANRARAGAAGAVAAAAADLEATAERRDPMATSALETARARLADAEAAVVAAERGAAGAERLPSDEELDAWRAERLELEAGVLAVDTSDPFPVRLALDHARASAGVVELVPDQTALDLADAIDEVDDALARAPGGHDAGPAGGDERAAARARLAEAQAAVAAAEAAVRGGHDRADAAALEAAHAAVLEARDAAARRFGGSRAAKRLAAAEAAEAAALERAGYATWTDYLMGAHRDGGVEGARRVEAARAELQAAAAAIEALDAAVADELRWAALRERRRALRAAAVDLLGEDPRDDVAGALRRHRVAPAESGGVNRLRSALEATGLVLGNEELPADLLVEIAEVWLEEHQRAVEERAALERRIAELDVRIAAGERARRAAEAGEEPAVPTVATALAAVEEARGAVAGAEDRVAHNEAVDREIAERRAVFEQAVVDEQAAVAALAAAERRLLEARDAERAAAATAAGAAAALDAARSSEAIAAQLLAGLASRFAEGENRVAALAADVERATAEADAAAAALAERRAALDAAREALAAAERDPGAPAPAVEPDADDAEWFLLARVAGQRAVSLAGSVPLVLDDALAAFGPAARRRLLDRLERMAATVQLVVLTDDADTVAWAEGLGADRATVATAQARPTATTA